jgi:hypothetical protein
LIPRAVFEQKIMTWKLADNSRADFLQQQSRVSPVITEKPCQNFLLASEDNKACNCSRPSQP